MRKGLEAAGFLCLSLFILSGPAYSTVHKARLADNPKQILKKHRHSVTRPEASRKVKTVRLKPGRTPVAQEEPLQLRASKGRHRVARPWRNLTPVVEQAADEADGDEYIEHRVKRGDTLERLAEKFNIDKEEIKDLNRTARRRLTPGSIVLIPKVQKDPEEAPTVLNNQPPRPWKNEDERGILVKVAKSFAGAPYRFGGDTIRGLDCSAFVKKMYEIFEVQLPRRAREQFYAGPRVDRNDLTTGDLVFFKTKRYAKYPTHVAIYVGDGKFIHASSLLGRGVRVDRLSDAYFTRTYAGAVRVKAPPADHTDAS
jgi:cell wall-associated NlpC family hydrolase